MVLDVVVTDKSGKPVDGLQQQDFTLLDNKQPRAITSFRAMDTASARAASAAQFLLLVDTVNTRFDHVAMERIEIDKFLRQNGGHLEQPVTSVLLTDSGAQIQNEPSLDGNAMSDYLDKAEGNIRTIGRDTGFYGAVEQLQISLETLSYLARYEATKPGRKLLIWVSPGWPILSGPEVELSPKQQRQIFRSIVNISDELRQARITLYDVDPLGTSDAGGFRTMYYKEFLKGVTRPSQVQDGNLALQVLAAQSGGLVLNSSNDVAGEITKCTQDAQNYYVLTMDAATATDGDQYHGIEIKLDKPGLTARTRTAYYAQP